jgi:hypothetical protein
MQSIDYFSFLLAARFDCTFTQESSYGAIGRSPTMNAVKALGGATVLGGSGFLVAQSWAKQELGEEALDRLLSFYSKAVPMVHTNCQSHTVETLSSS